jgi:uncharacterized protein YyaL (SSP411 family)
MWIFFAACLPFAGAAEPVLQPQMEPVELTVEERSERYLEVVRSFADTMIEHGRDHYGEKRTPVWSAILDLETLEAPTFEDVKDSGERLEERAIEGSNLQQDIVTLQAFVKLSEVTGDPKYRQAVYDYVNAYYDLTQQPVSGLIPWGEHSFYDMFADEPAYVWKNWAGGKKHRKIWNQHELLFVPIPWELLWEMAPDHTERLIKGQRYHFRSFEPEDYRFMRNVKLNTDPPKFAGGSSFSWITHGAQPIEAFAILYDKTQDPVWLKWAKGPIEYLWEERRFPTGLFKTTEEQTKHPGSRVGADALIALHAFRTTEYVPESERGFFNEHGLEMLEVIHRHAWVEEQHAYAHVLDSEGDLIAAHNPPGSETLPAERGELHWARNWRPVYDLTTGTGERGYMLYLQQAAIEGWKATDGGGPTREIAKNIAETVRREYPPKRFGGGAANKALDSLYAGSFGMMINNFLDLYELTGDESYLGDAMVLADDAINLLWNGKLFAIKPDADFYEAKFQVGDLTLALIRLHQVIEDQQE